MTDYVATGGRGSTVVNKLGKRIDAQPTDGPVLFPEARKFYTNVSRASTPPGFLRRAIESPNMPDLRRNVGNVREAMNNDLTDAVIAINIIREGHHLADYSGAVTKAALITEMLSQRRFSLFCEGHRWIDLRRYNLLSQLPIDRVGDDIWTEFPLPVSEQ